MLVPWKKSYDKTRQHIKKKKKKNRDITLLTKGCLVKAMNFPVVMYGCESCTIKKNKCWRTDSFELWCWRRLESSLVCKIKPVNPRRNRSWTFSVRTDAEAPILYLLDEKIQFLGKYPDAQKYWRQEEEGKREDGMVGWHYQLDGHEFE